MSHPEGRDNRPMILVVDDSWPIRSSLMDLIATTLPQCRRCEAESGEEAVEVVRCEAPDLVVMDIRLPGMSGIEATRRIKAIAPATQVVVVSILDAAAFREEAAQAGAAAYVAKSVMHRDLVPVLAGLLR